MLQWCYFQIFRATWRLWIQRLPRSCQTGSDILDWSWWKSCGVPIQQVRELSYKIGLISRNIAIAAHATIIADWELEGLDEAEIARKMKRIRLKRVLVKPKKITIFLVGEHSIAGYQVDVVGANLFREQEFGLGPIRGIGAHISCAFLRSDKVYMCLSRFM